MLKFRAFFPLQNDKITQYMAIQKISITKSDLKAQGVNPYSQPEKKIFSCPGSSKLGYPEEEKNSQLTKSGLTSDANEFR